MTTKNIILSIAGIVIIAVGTFYFTSPRTRKSNNIKSVNTDNKKQEETVFDGEGRKVVGPVVLPAGLVIIKAKNQAGINSAFSVNIYKDSNNNGTYESEEEYSGFTGSYISVGYKDAEAFNGAIVLKSDGGKYFAGVEGGRWQVTFTPMEKLLTQAPDVSTFSGNGQQVTKKFYLPAGKYSFRVTNKSNGNFIINMIDEKGNSTKRLVNKIGNFEGDITINNVFDGNYVFAVMGGDWTITKNK